MPAPSSLPLLPPTAPGTEWVGGRRRSSFFVEEGGGYRPDIILWLELPAGVVVGSTLLEPGEPPRAFARSLRDAMRQPLAGSARRPARIRVGDLALAAELRSELGEHVPVAIAPTPEIDAVLDDMTRALGESSERASYLDDGRVPEPTVARLFTAATLLWTAAPWRLVGDDIAIRVDSEALGLTGGCLSVLGGLGESFGFLLFPSLEGLEAFVRAAAAGGAGATHRDVGTSWLALTFERGADLPAALRREIAQHGWPVAAPAAHPVVDHYEGDGLVWPATAHELEVAAACATALTSFVARHSRALGRVYRSPISESYEDEHGGWVRLTAPYEAYELFEPEPARQGVLLRPSGRAQDEPRSSTPAPSSGRRAGRNDPCPCGSGRKYKRCHLREDEAAAAQPRAPIHARDERLVLQMAEWAATTFGERWGLAAADFFDAASTPSLFLPWAVYHFEVDGRPIVDHFADRRRRQLSATDLDWLAAQRAAWLSVWEVSGVEPGVGLTLADLLTGIVHTVHETSASQTLVRRDAVLGRVVTHGGAAVLCGVHPRPLPPAEAAAVVRRVRAKLRRKRAIPLERLRPEPVGRFLIAAWEEAVDDFDDRRAIPPVLHNTDGDPFAPTIDRFDLVAGAAPEVEARLTGLDGAAPEDADAPERCIVFSKPGNAMHHDLERTTIGTAWVSAGELRLETNSTRRADQLRRGIEAACAELVRHRTREEVDLDALRREGPATAVEPPPPEAVEMLVEMKSRHYAAWLDMPLPALDGHSPREAARTAGGRDRVVVLLKDLENHEARLPAAERFDVGALWEALGLRP
jgi:hypothetical protein